LKGKNKMIEIWDRKVVAGAHVVVCLLVWLIVGGCISGRNEVTYGSKGPAVGHETLRQVEVGKTTKDWLLATLGEPSSQSTNPDGTEILRYCYTKKVDSEFELFLLLDLDDKEERHTTLYFELKDSIVTKFWKEK